MASSLRPYKVSLSLPFHRVNKSRYPQVRSQDFRNDGSSSANIVDANLGVLRERIAQVRIREKLEACCRHKNGWNYRSGYDQKQKRDAMLSESLELLGSVSSALGFVFLSGSLCICFVSILVHLSS